MISKPMRMYLGWFLVIPRSFWHLQYRFDGKNDHIWAQNMLQNDSFQRFFGLFLCRIDQDLSTTEPGWLDGLEMTSGSLDTVLMLIWRNRRLKTAKMSHFLGIFWTQIWPFWLSKRCWRCQKNLGMTKNQPKLIHIGLGIIIGSISAENPQKQATDVSEPFSNRQFPIS